MADNTQLGTPSGVGDVIASDDIAGVKHQRVKLSVGADGAASDAIPVSNGLDTAAAGVPAVGLVGQYDDVAPGTVTENQFAPVRISSRRALLVEGVASGTAISTSDAATVTEGAAAAATPTGGSQMAVAIDIPATVAGVAIGDNVALRATQAGELWIRSDQQLGVQDNNVATVIKTEDSAHSTGDPGFPILVLRRDAETSSVSTDGDYANLQVDAAGRLKVASVGTVAHDGADVGAPLKIGGRADTTFQAAVADGDRVDALFDVYGAQFTRGDHPNKWSYHENSSSALTDAAVQAAPGAGLSVYITDIILSLGAATALSLFLEEGATTIIGPYYLEAVVGRSIHIRFHTPKKCTANTALTVTTSAAVAHGLDILGFIAP